jgi:hypothetical protein
MLPSSCQHLPTPTRPLQALHLAALRGHTQALELLLQAGFTTLQKSGRGWTVLDEALCMGHRAAASAVQAAMASEVKTLMKEKKALLLATMAELPDYSMQVGGGGGAGGLAMWGGLDCMLGCWAAAEHC